MTPTRNSPCPCGSGQKYKKCSCGAYEATQFPQRKAAETRHAAYEARMAALTPEERARRRAELMAVLGMMAAVGR